jgi:hypothetical protein
MLQVEDELLSLHCLQTPRPHVVVTKSTAYFDALSYWQIGLVRGIVCPCGQPRLPASHEVSTAFIRACSTVGAYNLGP